MANSEPDNFKMQRDLELVKKILNKLINSNASEVRYIQLEIEGYDEETIGYHLRLLSQAGFLVVTDESNTLDEFYMIEPNHVTWKGHEFYSALNNEKAWNKIKAKIGSKFYEFPFTIIQELLSTVIKDGVS